jgi:hypothetical protein
MEILAGISPIRQKLIVVFSSAGSGPAEITILNAASIIEQLDPPYEINGSGI